MAGHHASRDLRDRYYTEHPEARARVAILKAALLVELAAAFGVPRELTA